MYRKYLDYRAKSRRQIEKVFLSIVARLVIVIVLVLDNTAFAKTMKPETGWAIRQSSNFAGTVFSDITDHALRMHIGKLGLTVITRAPEWNALVFNENSKTYIDLPYKYWQKRFAVSEKSNYRDSKSKPALIVRSFGKTTNIEHFRTTEYWVFRRAQPEKHLPEERISQLWIASDIKAPPQIAQIFCSHLGIPAQKGIPLKAKRCVNGKMISALETLSVKCLIIPPSTFQPLSGYKKVKDEIELLMGDSNNEAIEDLLDSPVNNADSKLGIKK